MDIKHHFRLELGVGGWGGAQSDSLGEQIGLLFFHYRSVEPEGCSSAVFAGMRFFSEGIAWEAISQIELYKGLSNCFAKQAP